MIEPLKRQAAWLLMAVSGLSLAVAWVFASPVGASPDEGAHIDYAWGTVTGQAIVGEHLVATRGGGAATVVRVPQKLLQHPSPNCYKFRPEKPVTQCSPIPADTMLEVPRSSYMSRYPPLFYAVAGAEMLATTTADLSGPQALYGARLTSAVVSLLTVGFAVFLLCRRFPARVVLLATLLGFPATAWFLAASVNPNGLEVAAALLLAAGVVSLRVDHALGTHSLATVLAVPLGTLLLAWARPLSWVWASLILGLLLLPTARRDGLTWRQRLPVHRLGAMASATTVLTLGSSMAWFGYAFQIRSLTPEGFVPPAVWTELSPVGRMVLLVLQSGRMASEQVGFFGWGDTPLPTLAILAWVLVAGMAAAVWVEGRSAFMPRWPVVAVFGVGFLIAMMDGYRGAWGWQGRYLLPITAAACVLALPGISHGLQRLVRLRRAVPWMVTVLIAVNALSVVWFLFRNVYGVRIWPRRLPPTPLPTSAPSWVPPLGEGIVLTLVGVALVCGILSVWALRPVPEVTEGG